MNHAREIAIVLQESMTTLNLVYSVGEQVAEVVWLHLRLGRRTAMYRAAEMLDLVGIPGARGRWGITRTCSRAACASG